VPGLHQPGNQPLPNHAGGAGKKYSHPIIVGHLLEFEKRLSINNLFDLNISFTVRNVISRPRVLTWMRRTFAAAFVALGAKLAVTDR
jgi:hypothetical protein